MELAKFVARDRKTILPVFYGVNPSDVRHQSGPFEAAFRDHQLLVEERKVSEWREALAEVGEIAGYVLTNVNIAADEDKVKFIQSIVKRVLNAVNNATMDVVQHLVGIEPRVEEVMRLLSIQAKDVRMTGIHGMGGIGKTTIAKVVYNRIFKSFDASCFIPNVRETSKEYKGLVSLQKKLISEALKYKNVEISDISRGIAVIKNRFHIKRVLIVIDDVDHKDQLDALVGSRDWFRAGSRIIITTRYEHILNVHKVNKHEIYHPSELNHVESLQLFSYHAFGREQPANDYIEVSNKIVSTTGGLPLTLEVFGSFLFDKKHIKDWENVLERLKHIPFDDIQQRLKISYESLDEEEKKIFLDIACFFIDMTKDHAIDILKSCDFSSSLTIRVLQDKSLIKIDENNNLEMHDQLRDMGRGIVRENDPNEPSKHSRLWVSEEVLDVLNNDKGTGIVEGISVSLLGLDSRRDLAIESLGKLSNLRFLRANYANFGGDFGHMPQEVRWLEWRGCPLQSLPDEFDLKKLGVLDLRRSLMVQVWNESWYLKNQVFVKLRVLDLQSCPHLESTPNFSCLPMLEKLNLMRCIKLVLVHESLGNLNKLVLLDMTSCGRLKELPKNFCLLSNLETFKLSRCDHFYDLPEHLGSMESMKDLELREVGIKWLPSSIGFMKKLRRLSLHECGYLKELPDSIGNMTKLETLDLSGCRTLRTLPNSIGDMKNLIELDLSEAWIREIPNSIQYLGKLKKLTLSRCTELRSLPDQIGSLTDLEELDLRNCVSLTTLPDPIGNLKNLCKLHLFESSIEELPCSIASLEKLKELSLLKCKFLRSLPDAIGSMSGVAKLDLGECGSLRALPDSICNMKSLTMLDLSQTGIEHLPYCMGSLEKLKELLLTMCSKLQDLPDSVGKLAKLEKLDLAQCKSLRALPDSIGNMKNLVEFDLSQTAVEELPESIGYLEKLIELRLYECVELRCLPDQIGCLTKLEKLELQDCSSLVTLPDSFGSMTNLVEINLFRTGIERLPDSIGSLQKLKEFPLSFCEQLRSLPEQIGTMTKLEKLHLRCCESLRALPDSIGNLKSLMELDLSGSGIELLPSSIGSLENLKVLLLSRCKMLKSLPDQFGSITDLDELDLRGCKSLRSLPDSIGNMKDLSKIDLSETSIEELPDTIGSLEKLTTLSIKGCMKLRSLPLGRMRSLKQLHVMGRGEEEYEGEGYISELVVVLRGYSELARESRVIKFINYETESEVLRIHWQLVIKVDSEEWVVQVEDEHKREWGLYKGMQWQRIIFPKEFIIGNIHN